MTDTDWDDCWPEFDNVEEPKLGIERSEESEDERFGVGLPDNWIETGMMDDSTEMWFAHWS